MTEKFTITPMAPNGTAGVTGSFDGQPLDMIAVEDCDATVFVVEDENGHLKFEANTRDQAEAWIKGMDRGHV